MDRVSPPRTSSNFALKTWFASKIEGTRRYEIVPQGLGAMAAVAVLRNKVIKPLLAAGCHLQHGCKPESPSPLDQHYDTLRTGMLDLFNALRIEA